MELFIAGGVGEHGRNCFMVRGEKHRFLVDCGKMADMPGDPYPRLTREQIAGLNAVFLTHSHADHTGAIPWLYENHFHGAVIAAEKTLRQIPFALRKSFALEELCPAGTGCLHGLSVQWGRSGHCAGSVWYRFIEGGKSVLFSGDYTEDTQVYACDPIRGQQADLAVLDCAYGLDETTYEAACRHLIRETEKLLSTYNLLFFPVPKFGRGLEILKLFSGRLANASYLADSLFFEKSQRAGRRWILVSPGKNSCPGASVQWANQRNRVCQ